MADSTSIEWCDSTFNPWIGCTKVSPACDNCYAAVSTPARTLGIEWGAGQPRHRTSAANWALPLRWNRADFQTCGDCGWRGELDTLVSDVCPSCGKHENLDPARRRVFCASLSDWLDNEVPIEMLVDQLNLIRLTPNLDWLQLTKRIGNWRARLTAAHQHVVTTMGGGTAEYRDHPLWSLGIWIQDWLAGKAPANAWIGATICNQAEADRDIPKLLRVPAAARFLSIEPMLGPVDLTRVCDRSGNKGLWLNTIEAREANPAHEECVAHFGPDYPYTRIDWIICGGESGPKARPSHPDWFRSLRDQCGAAGVPFFFKQWGEWAPHQPTAGGDLGGDVRRGHVVIVHPTGQTDVEISRSTGGRNTIPGSKYMARVGKKAAGRLLDGVSHNEYPEGPCSLRKN